MINLIKFTNILNEALEYSEEIISLDEKIMTKRQARKRKLQAKRRAERKAAQKAKQQELASKEAENNVDSEQEETTSPGTALVVYEEPQNDEYDQISEDFTNSITKLQELIQTHKEEITKAMDAWKQAGEDKPCPMEVWQTMNNSITNFKENVLKLVQDLDVEHLQEPELQILDRYMTGINGYIEKASQQITAVKPNFSEEDLKQIETDAPGTNIVTSQTTQVTTQTGTALIPAGSTALTTQEEPVDITPLQDEPEQTDDKRKYKDLVSYKMFIGKWEVMDKALKGLLDGLGNVAKALAAGAKALLKLASYPADWLNDKLFTFLTSPLAKDMVKVFMYANPLTKMIFDGDFGNFSILPSLDKLHNALKNVLHNKNSKNKRGPVESNPSNYTRRHLPKSLNDLTLTQLKKEYYSNKAWVDLINVSFNHPEIAIKQKAKLQKFNNDLQKEFNQKDVNAIKNTLNNMIRVCNDICDSMDWVKPSDWQGLVKLYVKAMGGNTDKENKQIKQKSKSVQKNKQEEPLNLDKDTINQLANTIAKQMQNKQESFDVITNLQKLLEEAES